MYHNSIASCVAGGSVQTKTRHYTDRNGLKHKVQFREIDYGHGVKIFDLVVDGVLIPRIDHSLYIRLLKMSEESLAAYFDRH